MTNIFFLFFAFILTYHPYTHTHTHSPLSLVSSSPWTRVGSPSLVKYAAPSPPPPPPPRPPSLNTSNPRLRRRPPAPSPPPPAAAAATCLQLQKPTTKKMDKSRRRATTTTKSIKRTYRRSLSSGRHAHQSPLLLPRPQNGARATHRATWALCTNRSRCCCEKPAEQGLRVAARFARNTRAG